MAALTTATKVHEMRGALRAYPVAAGAKILRGSLVGLHPASRLAKPYEVCDELIGIADAEADNTAGAASAIKVTIISEGTFLMGLTGVATGDIGRPVFATSDNPTSIALAGHALGYIGRIRGVEATNVAIVDLKRPGELPQSGDGCVWAKLGSGTTITGEAGSGTTVYEEDGLWVASTLGLGTAPTGRGTQLKIDNTSEISNATLLTPAVYDLSKGVVLQTKISAWSSAEGTAMTGTVLDLDVFLADAVVVTDVDPSHHVRFHVDSGSVNILAGADDNSVDIAEADTGADLATRITDANLLTIIVRPGATKATIELWNGTTRLTAPDLSSVGAWTTAQLVYAGINIEKTAAAGIAVIDIARFWVFGAH